MRARRVQEKEEASLLHQHMHIQHIIKISVCIHPYYILVATTTEAVAAVFVAVEANHIVAKRRRERVLQQLHVVFLLKQSLPRSITNECIYTHI